MLVVDVVLSVVSVAAAAWIICVAVDDVVVVALVVIVFIDVTFVIFAVYNIL